MTSVTELTRQVDDERHALGRNLSELKTRAEAAIDWRSHVRSHPALTVGAALGVGMLLAQLHRPRPRSASTRNGVMPHDDATPRRPGVMDSLGESLMATAATAVAGMLGEALPGFRQEHERRGNSHTA